MEKTRTLLLGIFTVALCKYSQAEWNTTRDTANKTVSCGPHDNSSNCTDLKDIHQWSGHFSKCPDEYLHYCIHGMCRFVQEQNTPTCKCETGYIGARCEYLDLGWLVGEQREIVIISIISGLVILLLIIVFICICAQRLYRKKRRKQKTRDEVERLNTLNTNEASLAIGDVSDTNTV
ncbi:probetacellulin isoform X2 [Hemibagrus wyckioides]|uniref:probetacellulin isoform X2 n=1 Tax=Hemibagrus wyckioides TaxID=337641 RepID=UPI00266B8583|nr:probetacellulin isoform X2 [Hemibagrus wyckioides]